jgi:glycosyltransferase involved in cell wall biosynthesis
LGSPPGGSAGAHERSVHSPSEEGLQILWGSPLPPIRSGIADYAAELLPHLAELADVRVLTPPDWAGATRFAGLPMVPLEFGHVVPLREQLGSGSTRPPSRVEASFTPLLHLGNNPYHIWIARFLRQHPGVVVLHDTVLHHLLVEEAAVDGDWARFGEELALAHGVSGAALAAGRKWGMHGRLDPFLFPARAAYLRFARGVIVHSRQALALGALPPGDRQIFRQRLDAGADDIILTHLGFLTPAKGFDVILKAMLALRLLDVPARLVVVGEGSEAAVLMHATRAAGLGDVVRFWGFASEEDLGGILAATDLGLVPRFPTAGETSAAALRFLSEGVPVAVSGYRQFLELPIEAAFRLAPGAAGTVDLVRLVLSISRDAERLARARVAARSAWEEGGHPPRQAARALVGALEELHRELA